MAYLSSYAQTFLNASVTSGVMNMPAHLTDDILIAYVTIDSGTATFAGSTWLDLPSAPANPVSNGIVTYLKYLKAASAAETLTLTTADAYTCTVYSYRDVDTTTPFDGVTPVNTTSASGYTATASAVTNGNTDSLIAYLAAQETPSTLPSNVLSQPGVMWIDQNDTGGTTATTSAHQMAAWYINRAASTASPTPTFVSSVTSTWTKATFSLRNKSGGRIPAYIDDVTSPGSMITGGHHIVAANNITWTTTGITASINSKTVTPGAAANGADFGINPFCNAVTTTAAQTAANALVGPEATLGTALDASTGLIIGSFIAGSPKMGTFGVGTVADGGVVVRLGSGSTGTTAWNAYQVSAKDAKVTTEQRCVFAIEAGYSGSAYANGSSNCSNTAVKYIQFLRNAPYFSSTVYMSELHFVLKQVVAGGDSTYPVDISGLVAIGKSFRLPVIQQAGANGVVSFAPIQIGGGDAVYFKIDAGAIQFPSRATASAKDLQYHASDNKVGLYLAGKSGDTILLTNSVVTSNTPYVFEITSAATSAATWDFTGLTVVGAAVTLRNVMTFSSMTFSSFTAFDATGCALTSCVLSKPPATNNSITTNGSTTFSACSFNTTTVTAGNYLCSVASPSIFTNCTFTGSSSKGHAIRITTPGTYSLVGDIFTGYGTDASTSAAIYNDSGGAVTLNISGGGSSPTVRNGTSATTSVVAGSVTVTLTATTITGTAIQNANVLVKAATGGPMPFDATVTITNSGTTATVSHTAHGMATNDKAVFSGASLSANNGIFAITYINANSYSYTMGSSPGSNPTGTIKATFVVLAGLTDASGVISMSRVFASNQPITGVTRKSTISPLYKTAPIAGTISSTTGASLSALLISDE